MQHKLATWAEADQTRRFDRLLRLITNRTWLAEADRLNRQLAGWAAFYKFTNFTARVFRRIDRVIFWKLAHWLARKYRCSIKSLMQKWCRAPDKNKAKTWILFGISEQGNRIGKDLRRLVSSPKAQFRWRNPERNPYIKREEIRNTITSRYHDVAMALSQT